MESGIPAICVRTSAIVVLLLASIGAHADCWDDTEVRFGISRFLLAAIAEHESGMKPAAVSRNKDGSMDIGLMQINTTWLPTLKKYGIGIPELKNACVNLHVGAWILANDFAQYGTNWRAVGAYNAVSEWKRALYARKISTRYAAILRHSN
jgi:soluble lytic murein transglycosylase-like protein